MAEPNAQQVALHRNITTILKTMYILGQNDRHVDFDTAGKSTLRSISVHGVVLKRADKFIPLVNDDN